MAILRNPYGPAMMALEGRSWHATPVSRRAAGRSAPEAFGLFLPVIVVLMWALWSAPAAAQPVAETSVPVSFAVVIASWAAALFATGAAVLIYSKYRALRRRLLEETRHGQFLNDHDMLTQLPNRQAFNMRVESARGAMLEGDRIGIIAFDLSALRRITDSLGYAAGDALLKEVADRVGVHLANIDPRNVLARGTGAGFLCMVRIDRDSGTDLLKIAHDIAGLFRQPIETAYGTILVSLSIGVARTGRVDDVYTDPVQNAELALNAAKRKPQGQIVTYKPIMRAELQRRLMIEAELGKAIDQCGVIPYYQPQFDLKTGEISALEALARWHHPDLGWVSPAEFIPVAESSGDIVPLGRLILETACTEVQLVSDSLPVSVNLSVSQIFNDDVCGMVRECLARTGLPAHRLKLEVTESVFMTDIDHVYETLQTLSDFGVEISLDDFGTGYSALSYLSRFKWSELKIDRSFVNQAFKNDLTLEIIAMMLALARKMDAGVVVEGVETIEQRDLFASLGCEFGQGYLFGGPMSIEDIALLFFDTEAAVGAS
ncbi:putative bifunctional diguanylate cyclase/phosphodiesterase [Roseibium aquae]|nr:bifunctional diguanylate cyclase/phosphodiesterase [Roseibium aquae]